MTTNVTRNEPPPPPPPPPPNDAEEIVRGVPKEPVHLAWFVGIKEWDKTATVESFPVTVTAKLVRAKRSRGFGQLGGYRRRMGRDEWEACHRTRAAAIACAIKRQQTLLAAARRDAAASKAALRQLEALDGEVSVTSNVTRKAIRPGDGDPRHGTVNGYVNLSCRCQDCQNAFRDMHTPADEGVGSGWAGGNWRIELSRSGWRWSVRDPDGGWKAWELTATYQEARLCLANELAARREAIPDVEPTPDPFTP